MCQFHEILKLLKISWNCNTTQALIKKQTISSIWSWTTITSLRCYEYSINHLRNYVKFLGTLETFVVIHSRQIRHQRNQSIILWIFESKYYQNSCQIVYSMLQIFTKILIYISGLFWAWTMCWSNRWTSKSCPIFSGLYLWWFDLFRSTWDPNCNDSRYKVKSRWRRSRYVLPYRSVLQMAYGSTRSKHIFGKSVLIKVMINLLYIFKLT